MTNLPPQSQQLPTPHSLEAERALLGSLLLRADPDPILARVQASDFFSPRHRAIFEVIVAVHASGGAIDSVTVWAEITRMGREQVTGGIAVLLALGDDVAAPGNALHYAELVRTKAAARETMRVGEELARAAADEGARPDELIAQARQRLQILTDRIEGRSKPRGPQAVDPADVLAMYEAPQPIYSTGLAQLDFLLGGGLRGGTLTVLAAPPGSGKTSWCVGLARQMAGQLPVLWVSLELTEREMAARLAAPAMEARVRDILDCRINHLEAARAVKGGRVRIIRVRPYDPETGDPMSLIVEQARAMEKSMGTAPAILLDYLQLVAQVGARDFDKQRDSVAATAYRSMHIAEALGVPVIAVSSVSRGHYGPARKGQGAPEIKDPRDYISASKDAGEIEFAAANMLFLDVASEVDANGEQAVRMAVAKARHGRTDWVGLRFDGARGVFRVDPAATEGFGPTRKALEDDARVLDTVRTSKAPLSRTDLKTKAGLKAERALAAVVRLVEGGRLVEVESRRLDAAGRARAVLVCRLPEQVEQAELKLSKEGFDA